MAAEPSGVTPRRSSGRIGIDFAAVGAALVLAGVWLAPAAGRPLGPVEVDHVRAAERGWAANAFERGAPGPWTLIRFGWSRARGRDPVPVLDRAGYVPEEDPILLRHRHPPGAFALLGPAVIVFGREAGARWAQLGWLAVLGAALLGALRAVAPEERWRWLRAAAAVAVLFDPLVRATLLDHHVHVAVAAALLLPVVALARPSGPGRVLLGVELGSTRARLRLGLALGAVWAVAAIAPAWTLLFAVLLLPYRPLREWIGTRRSAASVLLVGVGVVLAVWPGSVLKVGLVQLPGRALDVLVSEPGRPWDGAWEEFARVVAAAPALAVYAGLLLPVLVWIAWRRRSSPALPAAAAGVAFLAVVVPFAQEPRVLAPLVPLAVVAVVAGVAEAWRWGEERSGESEPVASRGRGGARRSDDAAAPAGGGKGPGESAWAARLRAVRVRAGRLRAAVARRGVQLKRWSARAWPAVSALLLLAGAATATGVGEGFPYPGRPDALEERRERAFVVARVDRGERVLAEDGRVYEADVGARRGLEPAVLSPDGRRLLVRAGAGWTAARDEDWDRVVLRRRDGPEPPVFEDLAGACARVDRPRTVHFVCRGMEDGTGRAGG